MIRADSPKPKQKRGAAYFQVYWDYHKRVEALPEADRPHKVFKTCKWCNKEFYVYSGLRSTGWHTVHQCCQEHYILYRAEVCRTNGLGGGNRGRHNNGFNFRCPRCTSITRISIWKIARLKPGALIECHACGFTVPYKPRHYDVI